MTLVKLTKEAIEHVPKLTSDHDLIRSALIAELDAISFYATQIENLDDMNARLVMRHIIDEEKEHASELWCLLMKLDKKQEEKMTEVNASTCIANG